jgi:bifunctional non-homologous end joining protein LigD
MLTVDGQVITVTHPDKLLFPDDGITKGELVDYYCRIAEQMLPHVRDRPIHMNRFPNGIGGVAIQQKRIPESFPAWITRATVDLHRGGVITHAVIDNAATLAYLVNYNMVSVHVWQSRTQAPERPDQVVFDLDPASDDFSLVRSTARALRSLLEEIGLNTFIKTTGSRGLHVVVPISVGPDFETVHLFAEHVVQRLAATDADRLTTEFIKQRRGGRLFLDVNRNAYAQTAVAPYSVRERGRAPVAMPIEWSELDDDTLRSDTVNISNVWEWVRDRDDAWKDMDSARRPLPSLEEWGRPDRSGRRRGVSRQERLDDKRMST